MSSKTTALTLPEPRWFSVVIWFVIPTITNHAQILEFSVPAVSGESATGIINDLFTQNFYSPETQKWNLGGMEIDPWYIAAIPYPQYLSDGLTSELPDDEPKEQKPAAGGTLGKILQLFPNRPPSNPTEPPDGD